MPLVKRRELPLRVSDIMVNDVVTVKENDKIRDIAIRMYEKKIGSVVVVDDEGEPMGIVTQRDLIYGQGAYPRHPRVDGDDGKPRCDK